jgi:hypothetical protein
VHGRHEGSFYLYPISIFELVGVLYNAHTSHFHIKSGGSKHKGWATHNAHKPGICRCEERYKVKKNNIGKRGRTW